MKEALSKHRLYPWIVITLSAAFLFYKYILYVSPGIMTADLMQAFNINGTQLGNLAAVYFYGYLVVQIFAGPLLDKYGVRKITPAAILLCAIAALVFSQSHTLFGALMARAVIGMGVAFATVNYLKMAAEYFDARHFAFISGLLATAVMLGAVFGETPLVIVLHAIGWRQMLFLVSILGIIIAGLFLLLVKEKPPVITRSTEVHEWNKEALFKILASRQNWLLFCYAGLAFSPLAVLGGLWGNPFLQTAFHLHLEDASFLLSWIFIGLGVGSPILGLISDRLGKRRIVMQTSVFLSMLALVPVIYCQCLSTFEIGILMFLFGFFTGAFMLGFAVAKDINSLVMTATVVAMINTGSDIFGAITEPLVGKFLDLHWGGKMVDGVRHFSLTDYHMAFCVLPAYLLLAWVLLFFVKEPKI
ncbi:MAG TPA: MFS transporter [Gammaproteobacteria bacterium]|nr:MFS transporter [Gammaproteobacteria bacterium]